MIIPSGHTAESVLAAMEKVQRTITKKYCFGYYSVEDMKQQSVVFMLEVLRAGKYDPRRPLENFLWTHAHNRLLNKKRDEYSRYDPPCPGCHSLGRCEKNVSFCQPYEEWRQRNGAKSSLLSPVGMEREGQERDIRPTQTPFEDEASKELAARLDVSLPARYRADYLRMREGVDVPPDRRAVVEVAVHRILYEEAQCPSPSGIAA